MTFTIIKFCARGKHRATPNVLQFYILFLTMENKGMK